MTVETSDMPYALKLASDEDSVNKRHRQLAVVELRWISLLCYNFPCKRFVSS